MSYNPANAWPGTAPPAAGAPGYDYSATYQYPAGQYPGYTYPAGYDAAYYQQYQQYYGQPPPGGSAPPAAAGSAAGAGPVAPPAPPPGGPAPPSGDAPPPPPSDTAAPPASEPASSSQPPAAAAGTPAAAAGAAAASAQGYDYSQYYAAYYGAQGYAGYPAQPYPGQPAAAPPAAGAQQPAYPYSYASAVTGAGHNPSVPPPRPPAGPPPATSPRPGGTGANTVPVGGGRGSYNAMPPPSSLSGQQGHRGGAPIPLTIRPQYNRLPARPGPTSNPPAPSPASQPAYTRAGSAATPTRAATSTAARPGAGGGAGSAKFPPTFTPWVERCFARCRNDTERAAMTGKLTVKIKEVEGSGRMWAVDWDTEPIPSLGLGGDDAGAGAPSASGAQGGDAGGLRSKRSRWAESEASAGAYSKQQRQAQLQQQQGGKRQKRLQLQLDESPSLTSGEHAKRAARAGRFGDGRAVGGVQSWKKGGVGRRWAEYEDDDDDGWDDDEEEFDLTSVVIRGTCQQLEKSYFRLTAAPDPAVVRPEAVMRKALDRLVRLLQEGSVNYFYACDQFKGLRQDCTVQHLRNELVAEVYEAHARAALEYGDFAEFNQCQTQLAGLYTDGVRGCHAEFMAYKILYNTAHARAGANKALLHTVRGALALLAEDRAAGSGKAGAAGSRVGGNAKDPDGAVANALAARTAAFASDYPAFFAAYATAPALGRALLDLMAKKLRWAALNVLVRAYKAPLPVDFIANTLGFCPPAPGRTRIPPRAAPKQPLPGCRSAAYVGKAAAAATQEEGVEACMQWLQAHGAVVETPEGGGAPVLDVKSSAGRLFVPEEPKVAHGDDNLSLEDFLARASSRV